MSLDSEPFEIRRWHSPEYVESWMDNQSRESQRQALRKKLVSLLPFEPDQSPRVLDVVAGAGALSLEILGVYPNAQIVCQDFSKIMLGHARERLQQFSGRVTFVESDLKHPAWLQTIEETFDAVASSLVFHTVPTRVRKIYGEIFHMVKAGGCFLSGDHVAPPGPAVGRVYYKANLAAHQAMVKAETGLEKGLAEVEQELRERRRFRWASWSNRPQGLPSGAVTLLNHLEWLRQAGFDEVDCLWKDMRRAVIGGFKHRA